MDYNSSEEDQRIVQEIASLFDAPAYIRRARLVETSWLDLLSRLGGVRRKQLELVRLRLGQLLALAGGWEALRSWLPDEKDRDELRRLHDELQPRLRIPLTATTSRRLLRSALNDLQTAMTAFNRRWSKLIAKTDLQPVNDIRDAYNRYYLLEKECVVGSAQVARIGFQRLEPLSVDDVLKSLPLLKVPQITK